MPTINILPNDNNRVQIPVVNHRPAAGDEDKEAGLMNGSPTKVEGNIPTATKDLQLFDGHWSRLKVLCCFGRGTSMETRIVRRARALLERRQRTAEEERILGERDAAFEGRLAKIETSVAAIMQRLDRVLETLNN